MQLIVKPGVLAGEITAPPSKSYTHRAFIMGALAKGKTTVQSPLYGDDTYSTLSAISALGADVDTGKTSCTVSGRDMHTPDDIINVNNSGTTLRLMAAVASLLDGMAVFTGDKSIRSRPMQPLLSALNELGAECVSIKNNGCAPILTRGQIKGGMTFISGDISSQFISALLIACPFARKDTIIMLASPLKSRPYVDITINVLKSFKISVKEEPNSFYVKGSQSCKGIRYKIPGDFSSAAFPLVGAAITGGKTTVKNIDYGGPQGDRVIIDILQKFGAKTVAEKDSVTVSGGDLSGISIDCSDIPDLFPILSVLGACAKGKTTLKNAKHVRFKESDRISTMYNALKKMGTDVKEMEDGLIIKGTGKIKSCTIDSLGDHRILMACAIAGLRSDKGINITEPECYRVSYPAFLDDMKRLGMKFEIKK
ncbi:MAG: 3-phosphoshikimate 1-carboxyvinyltransferase [Thermoplasmata archaeon]